MSSLLRSAGFAGALAAVFFASHAHAADAQAERLLLVPDDGVGLFGSGEEVRLVADQSWWIADVGIYKRLGMSMPLSAETRAAIVNDPWGAWTFGFKGNFEIGWNSAGVYDLVVPARLQDGWDSSLSPSNLCTAAKQAAEEPGAVESGFIGWLDQRLAIADYLALDDHAAALKAVRAMDASVASGTIVDHSGGALAARVRIARLLKQRKTDEARAVAAGDNDAGIVFVEVVGLLDSALVEDAADVAGTLPPVDCKDADAALLGALTSSDLASIAATVDVGRTWGRATRSALLDLVADEVCSEIAEDPDAGVRCMPSARGAIGLSRAEVEGGELDLDRLGEPDPALKARVDEAATKVGARGDLWSDAFLRHLWRMTPDVAFCAFAPNDGGSWPNTQCEPGGVDEAMNRAAASLRSAEATFEKASSAWERDEAALREIEITLARYAGRASLIEERSEIKSALDRRASIETDLAIVEDELKTARQRDRPGLEERKQRFAEELAEDLLQAGASERADRMSAIDAELAAMGEAHAIALERLGDLESAPSRFAAAERAFHAAEARWAGYEEAAGKHEWAMKSAPYTSVKAWRRSLASNILAPWRGKPHGSVGFQAAWGYDSLELYLGGLHANSVPRRVDAFGVEMGGQGTMSLGFLALQVRGGVAIDQVPETEERIFCHPADSDIGGGPAGPEDQDCGPVSYIEDRPDQVPSGYLRLGALLLTPKLEPKTGPLAGRLGLRSALDLRLGLENLGTESPLLEARVALVSLPTMGPVRGRYGVGFRSLHHMTPCDAAGGVTSRCGGALQSFAPYVFVGGAFVP